MFSDFAHRFACVALKVRGTLFYTRVQLRDIKKGMFYMATVQEEILATTQSLAQTLSDGVGVCSELLQRATNAGDFTLVIEANTKLKELQKTFANAVRAMDPTKETPVHGADPDAPQPDTVVPLADSYPSFEAFMEAVQAYKGTEQIRIGDTVHLEGTEPALVYERNEETGVVSKVQ